MRFRLMTHDIEGLDHLEAYVEKHGSLHGTIRPFEYLKQDGELHVEEAAEGVFTKRLPAQSQTSLPWVVFVPYLGENVPCRTISEEDFARGIIIKAYSRHKIDPLTLNS